MGTFFSASPPLIRAAFPSRREVRITWNSATTCVYAYNALFTIPAGSPLLLRVFLPDGHEPIEIEPATVRWSAGERFGLKNMIVGESEWKRLRPFVVENLTKSDFATPRND